MMAPRAATLRATVAAIVELELRLHAKDFMAWLGVLMFFWLAFAHASGGPIQLVSGPLSDLPRNAPPVIAQAMAGLTAFGQVITAMTAATVALRDVSLRSEGIVLTSGVSWRGYLCGRFAATVAVLMPIYSAIPVGFAAGSAVASWRAVSTAVEGVATQAARLDVATLALPTLTLVLPNVLLVAAVFFAAGVLSGGFVVILFVGLGFIGLWQTGLAMVTRGHGLGSLVDPFGNAALTLGAGLGANRLLWSVVALAVLVITLWRWHPAGRSSADTAARDAGQATGGRAAWPALGAATAWRSEFRFGLHWVLRERGLRVLLFLALLNAIANGWPLAADASDVIRGIEYHARLFGILIATIYAGELVWRDREAGAAALLDALPISRDHRLAARAAGVLSGLLLLPAALAMAGALLVLIGGQLSAMPCAMLWLAGVGGMLFTLLFVVSLLLHRVVQHKTAAHLLLISAWVLAIALGADALATPWQVWGSCGP